MTNDLRNPQDTTRDPAAPFAPVGAAVEAPDENLAPGYPTPDPGVPTATSGHVASDAANVAPKRGALRNPATGQFEAPDAPAVRARVAALVADLQVARGLPAALVEALRVELASLVVAIDQLSDRLGGQLLTPHGRLRSTARTRQRLIERAMTLAGQLGFEKPDAPSGKRPWSKLTRQEQEAEAERAREQVERNLRGAPSREHEDDDDAVD